ncbi:MAG: ribosome silencing factor [Candidatus Methylomirabilales bacterium]
MGQTVDLETIVGVAVHAAWELKAEDPVVLDLRGLCSFTDQFLICSGDSDRQVRAIANRIGERLGAMAVRPHHREGEAEGKWILLDYDDLIIHIFDHETRRYYDLERLWADAPRRRIDGYSVR